MSALPALVLALCLPSLLWSQDLFQDMEQHFPDGDNPIGLSVFAQGDDGAAALLSLGTRDYPPGLYQIPNSGTYIANIQGQEGLLLPRVFFGAIGADVGAQDETGAAQKQVADVEKNLVLDLAPMVQDHLKQAADNGLIPNRFTLQGGPDDAALQVVPSMVFSYVGDTQARLWLVLRASYIDKDFTKVLWRGRYIVGLGRPRPFRGTGGWVSLVHGEIEAETQQDLSEAVRLFLLDIGGKLRDDHAPQSQVRGCWVFYKHPMTKTVRVYLSNDLEDVVIPQVDIDDYFSGINVLPKSFTRDGARP